MNLDNFPQKNLPKELIDIPLGQIYILTNPNTGITSQDIFMMQFIFSMAKGLNQERVISTMSVDNHLLWGCCICKVQTDQGIQILVANRESIVELLCEYWGLDYEDVSQTYVIKGRYRDNAKISMSGHPMRVALKSQTPGGKATSSSVTLNLLQVPTRSDTIEKIQRNIKDIISYDLDISIEDIVDWFNKELEKKKTYELNIYIEKKKVIVKSKPVMKIKTCDIFLTDSLGNKYPLNFQAEWKVIFLTYIMYKEGLYYSEVDSDEFYSIYEKIHSKMLEAPLS